MHLLGLMSRQQWLIIGMVALIVLVVGWPTINVIDQNRRMKKNFGASMSKKYKRDVRNYIYGKLRVFSLTRNYVDMISRRYELLYPGDAANIAIRAVNTTFFTWGACAAAIVLIWLGHINFINTLVSILVVYVVNKEIIAYMVISTEINLLEDMVLFISNIRHNFYIKRMIDDAILLSMKDIGRYESSSSFFPKLWKRDGYEMKVHADKLYEIVISSNIKEEIMNYNAIMHNKFIKMLLSLCINVMEYGDKTVKGEDLFAANLENLKEQINTEIIKMKKLQFRFSGFSFVTIAVCIPMDAIRKFALSIVPELNNIYNGRIGSIYVVVTIVTALVIYLRNNQLKESNRQLPQNNLFFKRLERIRFIKNILDNYLEKNEAGILRWKEILKVIGESLSPRQFLLKKMVYAVAVCLSSIVFVFFLHDMNQNNIVSKVVVLPENITVANKVQTELMKDTIIKYVQYYKDKDEADRKLIVKDIIAEGTFYNTKINEALADEAVRRIHLYKNEYFKFYELLICFGLSIIAYHIPYRIILHKKKVMQLNMDDEVNQLNAIIYMLMYSDHITIKDLLEELELFSVVFRQTIHECINDYNSGDIEALEQMKEKEAYGPFIRLVDNLIRCDDMAIYKAFDEIASDRENYYERKILDDEISIQRKVNIALPLSWIPTVMVMIYLLLPILTTAIGLLDSFKEMTTNI
jgi:hypothetical protein